MEAKKSGLRQNATVIAAAVILLSLAALLIVNVLGDRPKHQSTAEFLQAQFVEGQYIEGFTPGTADYGFSLEALAQLSANSSIDTSLAKEYLLESSDYIFDVGEIKLGLAGKFLYASKVTGATNAEITKELIEKIKEKIGQRSPSSTFDYSWLVLGLYSQDERELANKIAGELTNLQRDDGGYGFDASEFTTSSTADATAMAIMALRLSSNGDTDFEQSISKAVGFLKANLIDSSYFVAYESEDVNGTALALMALSAVGEDVSEMTNWLEGKLQPDGGIGSPWVENAGDKYATAQGYLALEGKSYLDLIGK